MYRKIEDFEADWAQETEATLRVFRSLTDGSLLQRVTPEGRSMGRLAWHVAATIPEMAEQAGIKGVSALPDDAASTPEHAAAIADAYEAAAHAFADAVRSQWSDEDLREEIPMYGDMWSKGLTLSILVRHQAHHRGQLTVLMRQAGLAVPGCYGPAREEWAAMGMAAME